MPRKQKPTRPRGKGALREAVLSPQGLALLLIFALALLVRWYYSARTGLYTYDSYYYLALGRNLSRHFTYSIHGAPHCKFLPLYPAATGFVSYFTGDLERAGNLVNLLCFSCAVFPVYGIGRRCFSRISVGLLAAFFLALEPITITWASLPMSEGLYTLLVCASVYLLVRWWEDGKDGWLWGCAAVGGLAAVTRWEGLLMFAALGLPALWRMRRRGSDWKVLAIAGCVFLLPFALWSLRNLVVLGDPFRTAYSREISGHPGDWEGLTTWMRLKRYAMFSDFAPVRYTDQMYNYLLLAAGYAGYLAMALVRRWRRWLVVLVPWLLLLGPLHFLWYYASSRFLAGAVPALCLGAGLTLSLPLLLAGRLDAKAPVKAGLVLMSLALAAAIGLSSLPVARDMHERYVLALEGDNSGLAVRQAAEWIKTGLPPDAMVVSNAGPMVSFYLGRDALNLGEWQCFDASDIDPPDAAAQMRDRGVEYMLVFAYTPDLEDALRVAEVPLDQEGDFELVGKFSGRTSFSPAHPEGHAFVLRLKP